MGSTAARPRSRATMWKPTTAATSTSSTAPIPGCTFWSLPAKREGSQGCHKGYGPPRGPSQRKLNPQVASHPAVEPGHAVVGLLGRARPEHLVAQLRCRPARVVEVAVDAGHDLHARRAQVTLLHVGAKGYGQIIGVLGDFVGEPYRILG